MPESTNVFNEEETNKYQDAPLVQRLDGELIIAMILEVFLLLAAVVEAAAAHPRAAQRVSKS